MSAKFRKHRKSDGSKSSAKSISTRPAAIESLEERQMFAVVAAFTPASATLTVFGDALDNNITVSRNAAGQLLVNGGAVSILGGSPTVANTGLIQVFGQGGNDVITLSETNGALPRANLFGGAGNDVMTGGSGADMLFGQAGNDTLLGKGGFDFLFGGSENDVMTGGDGNDQSFGESGNDRMVWNPGDDTDLNEGGDGFDTVEVNGGNGAEAFTVTANGTRVRFDRVNPAPFSLDIGTSESLAVNANGGDDTFVAGNGLSTLIQLVVDGGTGNDSITGGDGADILLGGDGNDAITGGRGADVALMGAGDDTFVWNPGDGSDVVEGQSGADRMLFNGANISEVFDVSANGGRVRFTRNVAAITMDLDDVEAIDLNALGGADVVTVNDMAGTDLATVNVNLAGFGAVGDAQPDTVIVNGTNGDDVAQAFGDSAATSLVGLFSTVNVTGAEAANDRLAVNLLAGDDVFEASNVFAGGVGLVVDGGDGNDILIGSAGNDVLAGSAGDDVLIGGPGLDILDGGLGSNVLIQD